MQDADGVTAGGGVVAVIFSQALTPTGRGIVLLISTAGQFFCTVACMTSTTRMLFAFSRDGAVPGGQLVVEAQQQPGAGQRRDPRPPSIAAMLTLPALVKVDINGAPVPVAFFAVVSIGVIGLYVAFAIPIFLRWKAGDTFDAGLAGSSGRKYRWMAPVAVVEIAITSIVALLPTSSRGVPWNDGVRVEVRQLHADRRGRRADPALDLLAPLGEELVHRAEDHHRPAAGRLVGRRDQIGAPRHICPSTG